MKRLFSIGILLITSIFPSLGNSHDQLAQETSRLDSLKKNLSLSTDSLEVAELCYEIYHHIAYGLMTQRPEEGSYLMRALRNFKDNEKWSKVGKVYRSIGGAYFDRNQFSTARKYWMLSQDYFSKTNDLRGKVTNYGNLSETYMHDTAQTSQALAKAYLDSANDLAIQINDSVLLMHPFLNFAEWHSKRNEMDIAEKYTSLSISLAKRVQNAGSIQAGIFKLGLIKKKRGNLKEAIALIEESLNQKAHRKSSPFYLDAILELSNLYFKLENFKMAYRYLHLYTVDKETLFRDEEASALLNMETSHETEKRDLIIKKQESDIALLAATDKIKDQWILFGSTGLIVLFAFILVVRSRSNFKKQKKSQEKFSAGLIEAQEEERTRIAKELHDSIGQQLTLIKKKAQNENQNELSSLANAALEEARDISRALYPSSLRQLGLSESIEQLLYELDEETSIFFLVNIDNIDHEMDEEKTLNFYRFIQESVSNVIKHAKATTLEVSVSLRESAIKTLIKDNGCGFKDVSELQMKSLGMKTMSERIRIMKGTLSIQSIVGKGTTIIAKLPI
ncbi:sensor histidine kinase [Ekhidna sp.]